MECNIRPWQLSDAFALSALLNNKNILDNLRDGLPFPYTEADGKEFISAMLAADKTKTFSFAITQHDKVIGSIGAFREGNIHYKTAELGYYLGQAHWGNGLCVQAVNQICQHIFTQTDIIRIFAQPFAKNTASCRVLEKAGFVFEGVLHCHAEKNGKILDMRQYAKIKDGVCAQND